MKTLNEVPVNLDEIKMQSKKDVCILGYAEIVILRQNYQLNTKNLV